jgi:hypothetical protein
VKFWKVSISSYIGIYGRGKGVFGKMAQSNIVPIVTSVNMDDYLSVTIKNNRPLFDRYYVLTCAEDEATSRICKEFDADLIVYEHFFDAPKCVFNKSGGVRRAQEVVHQRHRAKWVILIDVDILLPYELATIDTAKLTKRWLYGMNRLDAQTYEDYLSNRLVPYHQKFSGYFQMYHNKSALYQKFSFNASWCDTAFRNLFPRRALLPGIHAIHIGHRKMHWDGRDGRRLSWG